MVMISMTVSNFHRTAFSLTTKKISPKGKKEYHGSDTMFIQRKRKYDRTRRNGKIFPIKTMTMAFFHPISSTLLIRYVFHST